MSYLLTFLFSLAIGLISVPIFRKVAVKFGVATEPRPEDNRKVPYLGGLAIYLSFIVAVMCIASCTSNLTRELQGILIACTLIMLLGLVDDTLKELPPLLKFGGQLAAVIILILFNVRTTIARIPLWLNLFITVVWIIGITNAFNLLDILDGLAGGLAAIAAFTFLVVAILTNDVFIGLMASALAGSSLAFLRYNLAPVKIFMGDAGSLFLGFTLAAIAIPLSYAPSGHEIALLVPIFIFGVPIYDTFFVSLMRIKKGKPIFRGSADHFALRLIKAGYNQKKSVLIMYLFAIFFSGSALILLHVKNWVGIIIVLAMATILFIIGKRMSLVKVD